jgi:hypothetical protein
MMALMVIMAFNRSIDRARVRTPVEVKVEFAPSFRDTRFHLHFSLRFPSTLRNKMQIRYTALLALFAAIAAAVPCTVPRVAPTNATDNDKSGFIDSLLSPNASTVWATGDRVKISWTSTNTAPEIYPEDGLSIGLFRQETGFDDLIDRTRVVLKTFKIGVRINFFWLC